MSRPGSAYVVSVCIYLCIYLFFISLFILIMINRMNTDALVLLLIFSEYVLLKLDDNVGEECK